MELIHILKYLAILYLIILVCFWIWIFIRIVISGGITSYDTPPKDTPKVQEMYCGCGGKRPPPEKYL